ncbi:MAG: HAD-IA family hydrolase [Synechococcus sp. Tobar2m-G35]|nr:HAD-IA family hydrolase [Synechococcus sp. Tobar2m-G35]
MISADRPLGCLFDLDGLLLDTEPLHAEAWTRAAAQFGAVLPPPLLLQLRGRNRFDNAATVIAQLGLTQTVEQLLAVQQPLARSLMARSQPMPGARELLVRCQRAGIPTAIATSSSRGAVSWKQSFHPWLEAVAVQVCGDDAEVANGKPAPDLFLVAARRLGIAAHDCWAFEDSPAGAVAARAAGCRVFVLPAPGLGAGDYPAGSELLAGLAAVPL